VPVPCEESNQSYICVLEFINYASFYYITIGYWNCSNGVVFFFFILFHPWSYYINMLSINDNPVDGDSHDIFIFLGPI
jgi:hypothetical protein